MLPLFPLNTVLFPGCILDLQIFEARYLDMVARCLRQGQGFGVVGLLAGREVGAAASRFAQIGCEALIRDWHQQDNGLLGIRVQGGRRFRVLGSQVQADQLLLGQIDWCAEGEDRPLRGEHADSAALLQALAQHPMVAALGMGGEARGQRELAYQLAYLLPLGLEQKLELLEQDDVTVRLDRLERYVEALQGELNA